jgi:hypothetical protein
MIVSCVVDEAVGTLSWRSGIKWNLYRGLCGEEVGKVV